ncbi:poly(A) polymerase [Streptomyces sp. cmx-4-9]|uniref:poly(A) polymerase n=1 Tax=Streptomyces sp. cmx-4-9 TaxID=2790941 RepID=UPI00397FA56F
MRTSEELYHRVRWDSRFDPSRFVLGLLQRGAPPKRVPLPSFVPGGDIPWHRVLFVEADGELVWDRATGVDRIDATGAGRARDALLLRPPFFTTLTPHAWDPADGGAWRPAAAGPRGAGAAAAAAAPDGVRLLTWNTLWDRYDAPRIATARRRPMLLADLAAADADVIVLQEVEPALLDLLLGAPWVRDGYTVGTDPRGRDVDEYGLLVLSRLPVREAGAHRLGSHKALTAVAVDTAAGPLVVAATHLTSDHMQDGAGRRAAELAGITEGLAGIGADVALLGDFNDGRTGAVGPAAVLGMRDAWNEVYGAADETPTFDPVVNPLAAIASLAGRSARLDRILLRSARARVSRAALRGDCPAADGLFVSDHFGVEATVEFGQGGGARPAAAAARLDVPATARTALAWLPPHDPAVEESRAERGQQAGRWPEHVDLLCGFVPESAFDRALPLLAAVAAGTAPFTVRPEGVHGFGHGADGTRWPDPASSGGARWQELRAALAACFPGCRCGEGHTPHRAPERSPDPEPPAAAPAARLGGAPPVRVGELAVLSRRGDGPMELRATVALGTGEVRWAAERPAGSVTGSATGPTGGSAGGSVSRPAGGPVSEPAGGSVTGSATGPTGGSVSGPADGSVSEPAAGPVAAEAVGEVAARVAEALDGALVQVAGSRRMGCDLPGADLDLVAVLPGTPGTAQVRSRLLTALPGVSRIREVAGARTPGLRFRAGALDVDLVLVGCGGTEPDRALSRRSELGEGAALALSALSDADAVRESVRGQSAAWGGLAREVKAWARSRGLDSAPFGGLPGLAWAVLAARTVREAGPGEAGPGEPGSLLREFFGMWAAWDWREPVALTPYPAPTASGAAGRGAAGPVTVLTPSEPVRSCTALVGPGMRDLLARELYRAWELLEEGPEAFSRVTAPPPLHRRHAAWAVVTVRGAGGAGFEESLGRLRGRMGRLLGALEEAGVADAHAWPRPFASGPGLARYAVGLGAAPPDAAGLERLARRPLAGLPGVALGWAAGGDVPDLL